MKRAGKLRPNFRSRAFRYGAAAILLVCLLFALASGLLAWRLSDGPIGQEYLTAEVRSRLKEALPPGVSFSLRSVGIERMEDTQRISLVVHNLQLTRAADGARFTVPRMAVRPKWAALLIGRFEVSGVEAFGPIAELAPAAGDGAFLPDANPYVLATTSLTVAHGVVRTFGVRWIALHDLRVGRGLEALAAEPVSLSSYVLDYSDDAIRIAFVGDEGEGIGWSMQISARRSDTGFSFEAKLADIVPERMTAGMAGGDDGVQFSTPVTGSVKGSLAPDGRLGGAEFDLKFGAGFLGVSAKHRALIDEAHISGIWLADREQLIVNPSTILAARTEIQFQGTASIPGSGNFAYGYVPIRLDFGKSMVSGDGISDPVTIDRGIVAGVYMPSQGALRIDRFDIASKEAAIAISGVIGGLNALPFARIEGGIASMPVDVLKRVWPAYAAPGAREWVIQHILGGDITSAQFSLTGQPGVMQAGGPPLEARLEFAMSDVAFTYLGSMPPIRNASARAVLNGDNIELRLGQGAYVETVSGKRLDVSAGSFIAKNLFGDKPPGAVAVTLQGDAGAIVELLDNDPINLASDKGLDPDKISGTADADIRVELPLISDVKLAETKVFVNGKVNGLSMNTADGRTVEEGMLEVTSDGTTIALNGHARIDGVDANINLTDQMFGGSGATQTVTTLLGAEERQKMGFSLEDLVSGDLPVEIVSGRDEQGRETNDVTLDLTPVRMSYPAIGLDKPPGAAATAKFRMVRDKTRILLKDLTVTGSGLDIAGNVTLDPGGEIVSAQLPRFSLRRADDASVTMKRGRANALNIEIKAESLDVRSVLSAAFANADGIANSGSAAPLNIVASIGKAIGHDEQTMSDVKLRLTRSGGRTTGFEVEGSLDDDAALSGSMKPGTDGQAAVITIKSGDAGALMRFAGIYSNMQGGSFVLVARTGQQQGYADGGLRINDFVITNDTGLGKIVASGEQEALRVGDQRAGSNMQTANTGNLPFRQFELRFTRQGDLVRVQDGVIRGQAMGATVEGEIDFSRKRIGMAGTYVPLYAINSIFGKIPIIGPILGGRKNEGLVGISYSIRGSIEQPILTVNPVSAVTPGVLRFIFEQPINSLSNGSAPQSIAPSDLVRN
ncbi:MAG: AsmA-like C-terminal domain-containing protein [Rhodobiaceae bacterium]|nr:AsmA-like C-terminal domain-containing protein [Rhodobiaceae bacterium]MCC0056969.1 AsmA-like C-terminal domain-containing protein [Rhodobiaceae bacterium]